MRKSRGLNFLKSLTTVLCLFILIFHLYPIAMTSAQERDAQDAVTTAWSRARDAGAYRYTADIVQTTTPKATVTNVGRKSTQSKVHLEGESDVLAQSMTMDLWVDSGHVQDKATAIQIRIENDRALARQGTDEWREIDNFTGLFAPQGDFMAFLAAAKDIASQGTETRQVANLQTVVRFTRYTFRVDGLSYARYLREKIEQRLLDNHELPPGVNLDLPRQYVDMTGDGELWVSSDGLPLRQVIHIQMPERDDVQVTADMTVDFYDFGYTQSVSRSVHPRELKILGMIKLRTLHWNTPALRQFPMFLSLIILIVLMLATMRSRKLYAALAITVVIATVTSPLLQSLQAAGFYERQAARQQAQTEQQEESTMIRDLRRIRAISMTPGRLYHPNHPPLHPLRLPGYANTGTNDFDCQDDSGADTDGDGLTDCQEGFLGTNPDAEDSDGDTLGDALEVAGFAYGGKTWYTDPLEPDSNRDGISDRQEWNLPGTAHAIWDLDGDSTPDLFDRDNDGDGVPDDLDLSPFTKKDDVTFSADEPFSFQIDNLNAGRPTYVEFQLRPKNPDHLWYALNVLDWPADDNQAQVQDDDDKTFYDVDPNTAFAPNSNGDLKLVPMLEIRISGTPTNLPSQQEMDNYGMFVKNLDQSGSDKAVYVPLHLVTETDDEGRVKSRVAFIGKMLYRPEGAWGNVQQVRLVWVVQALVDVCAKDGYQDGICETYVAYNRMQIAHIYYDDWTLTGLSVREDHGVNTAIIYEDPAVDDNLRDDTALIALAAGLDYTFMSAWDENGVTGRDITVNEIARRFDHNTNQAISDEERWAITNTLSVETHSYEHQDEALVTIPMSHTKALLERVFTPHWSEAAPITPTLLFAREERYRITNLDVQRDSPTIAWHGRQLNLALPSSGDYGVPVQTLAGLNWGPYRFRAGWEACPIETYWDELARRYPFEDVSDLEEAAGLAFFLQLYYLGLYRGNVRVVELGDIVQSISTEVLDRPWYLSIAKLAIKEVLKAIVKAIINIKKIYESIVDFFKDIGKALKKGLDTIKTKLQSFADWVKKNPTLFGFSIVGIIVGLIVLVATIAWLVVTGILGYAIGQQWAKIAFDVSIAVISLVIAVIGVIYSIIQIATTSLSFSTFFAWSLVAAAISAIVITVIIWGVFLYAVIAHGLTWFGLEFNTLLAYSISTTLFNLLLIVIGIIPFIGPIVVALFLFVDQMLNIFAGFTIQESITQQVARVMYFGTPTVEVSEAKLTRALATSLQNSDLGLTAGNGMKVDSAIKTTLEHYFAWQHDKETAWFGWFNAVGWPQPQFFQEDDFRSTTIKYTLAPIGSMPPTVARYQMTEDWSVQHTGGSMPLMGGQFPILKGNANQPLAPDNYVKLQAGVNYKVPLVLHTSYALPTYTCLFGFICWEGTTSGASTNDLDLVYDIFPATLDEFYAWDWDARLATPRDADGDGLIAARYDGNDPDDTQWDTDGDGLSDAYEMLLRQDGVVVSYDLQDTDSDGLSDAEEMRRGTDPTKADTDGDGLDDQTEVEGWAFKCGTSPTHAYTLTWATSDPIRPDTDGDGMDDTIEKVLNESPLTSFIFHPRVANNSPIAIYTAIDDADGTVAPGTPLAYTVTVHNNLITPLYATGNLFVDFPDVLRNDMGYDNFTLFMGEALTLTADATVQTGVGSQSVNVANQVSAHLVSNPACARIYFDTLHCDSEADTDIPWWYAVDGSEVVVRLDGGNIWHSWPDKVLAGQDWPLNVDLAFCDQSTILVLEDDDGDVDDDTLETWTISAQNPGSFSHPIDDLSTHFVGSLSYSVYYPGELLLNLTKNHPILIDADSASAHVTSFTDGQYVRGTGETLVIGGNAQDPTSSVKLVEISVNDGAWSTVSGTESWAWTWQVPVQAGSYTFRTRTTDVVDHFFTDTVGTTVIVDIYRPDVNASIESGATLTATQNADGRWVVPLSGTVVDRIDAGVDMPPGSGVHAVEVLLEGTGEVAGRAWQTATLSAQGDGVWAWQLDYVLPAYNNDGKSMTTPTGEYTFIVRATDNVGNTPGSPLAIPLRIDNTAPIATVTDTGPLGDVITRSLSIGGVITDPGVVGKGIAALEIAYTPLEVAQAFSPADIPLLLHLDEATGATVFRDAMGNHDSTCQSPMCPTTGENGIAGTALRFDGTDDYGRLPDLPPYEELTGGVWVKITELPTSLRSILHHDGWSRGDVHTHLTSDGTLEFALNGNSPATVFSDFTFDHNTFDQWVHVAYVYDAVQKRVDFYINGELDVTHTLTTALVGDLGPGQIGNWDSGERPFDGLMDELVIFDRALSATEVKMLVETTGQPWFNWEPTTLAQSGPGITQTTWSHIVPGGLAEGFYQIDLRGTDVLSNRNANIHAWSQWWGEIDLYAPYAKVELQQAGTGDTARTEYTCKARDFTLSEDGFQCPCPVLPGDRYIYDAPQYSQWLSDTARLYRIETSCLVQGHQPIATAFVRACDRYGHCAEDTPGRQLRATASITSPLDSVVFTPTYGTVLLTTDPISIAGGVYAERTLGLKALTVTLHSAAAGDTIIYTDTWPSEDTWGGTWSTTWNPATFGDGAYTLFAVAADYHNYVQTTTHPITFYVDTLQPDIAFPTEVVTTGARLPSGRVAFTAPYTEAAGVAAIRVQQHSQGMAQRLAMQESPWVDAMLLDEDTWRFTWLQSELADSDVYTFTVKITDVAGRSTQETGAVTLDLTPPSPVSVTLAYTNGLGVYTVISPGQTLYDADMVGISPTLIITWTASDDHSGIARNRVGWSETLTPDFSTLATYGTVAPRRHVQQVRGRTPWYAHVIAEDAHSNPQVQTLGPIYVDAPTTPDYVAMDYHGWMQSGCAQIGANRELARYARTGQSQDDVQRFYTTWNSDTLRLAWTGANWNSDGDIFIYLDTGPGGATEVYNPYTNTTHIAFPPPLAADYAIWVEDDETVKLMQWDGLGWADAVTDTFSSPLHYDLATSLRPIRTDLSLPFGWLGITTTTSVRLLAIASEEDALKVWATMPDKNPLNSQRATNALAAVNAGQSYTLTQAYAWTLLGADRCPNEGQFTDADLRLDLTADPPGTEVGYLEHNVLALQPGQPLDADLDGEPDIPVPLGAGADLVGHGQIVTYTLHYANQGTEPALGVQLTVTARGAMQLARDPLMLTLGDVNAGISTTLEFTGVVDTALYTTSVEVQAAVADAVHDTFDWFWVQHDVDAVAPESVKLVAPLTYLKPYTNTLHGTVYDTSDVPSLALEARTVPTDTPSTYPFSDTTPGDGQWTYAWNIGAQDNGARFKVRPLATDRFGNGPTVGDWVTLTVDSLPPTITLDAGADTALQGIVFNRDTQVLLTGKVGDDQQAAGMEICFGAPSDAYCEQAPAQPGDAITGTWRYVLRATGALAQSLDYEALAFYLYGLDGAGNRSTETLSRTYIIDTVPPKVTVDTWIPVVFGVTSTTVLSGTVTDGSGVSELYVILASPGGGISSTLAVRDGDAWAYTLSPTMVGTYTLRLEARDAQGNTSGYGPFDVVVREALINVLTVSPRNGATDVARDAPLRVSFSGPVLTNSVAIRTTPTVALTPTWDAGGVTLTLQHSPLAAGQRYTVTVTDGIDLNGSAINNIPYTWAFTTQRSTLHRIYLPLVIRAFSRF